MNQRRESGEVDRIHVCPGVRDEADRLDVVAERRRVQGIGAGRIGGCRVAACVEEQPHDRGGAVAARSGLQRRAPPLRRHLHVCAAREQQAHLLDVGRRPHQRRGAGGIRPVRIGAVIEQERHRARRSDGCRIHEGRRAAAGIRHVHIRACLEHAVEPGQIVRSYGRVERVAQRACILRRQDGGTKEQCDEDALHVAS